MRGYKSSLDCLRYFCSNSSGKGDHAAKQTVKKSIANTLHLPKTSFPLKSPAGRNQNPSVVDRLTSQAYQQQARDRSSSASFSLLDGPPFANGQLHAGHFLNKVLKDVTIRYQVGLGKRVRFVPGWDCHGLPIELMSLKASKPTDSQHPLDIRKRCKAFAQTAIDSQKKDFKSWGVLADWENQTYTTMDKQFESKETLVLKRLVESGLVYRGSKPVYWSPASQTALAEAELEYKDDHVSTSVYVKFGDVTGSPVLNEFGSKVKAVIWTTTPWSLTANKAIAVHNDADYVVVAESKDDDDSFILVAEKLVASIPSLKDGKVVKSVKGKELVGALCDSPLYENVRVPIIHADHVTVDSGTGLVHIAPCHGVDDWDCYLKAFPSLNPNSLKRDIRIDNRGVFNFANACEIGRLLEGKKALSEGNTLLVDWLANQNKLVDGKGFPYTHKYPYDWRTKTPVMTRLTDQFFVRLDTHSFLAQQAISNNKVSFLPPAGEKRLSATIETRKEWCISRQRVWGLPIPYYVRNVVGQDEQQEQVLFTPEIIQNFSEKCAEYGSDFWFDDSKLDLDDEILPLEERGKGWKRGKDTLDVWFDSGSAWFASEKERTTKTVDDLVSEGSDQHRGWFQSSLLTKIAMTGKDQAPFQALVTHGFILDEKGQKMSKSLGNVVAPSEAISKYGGVDVLRFWACFSDACGGDVSLGPQSLNGAADHVKKIRNMMRFFLSVCEESSSENDGVEYSKLEPMDRFILHNFFNALKSSRAGFDAFNVRQGLRPLVLFLTDEPLTVYMDQTKDRLYCERLSSQRRRSCVTAIRHMLIHLTSLFAPICVFTCDELLEHGKMTFKGARFPSDLLIQDPPREWLLTNPIELKAFELLMQLRAEINQLGLKDEGKHRAKITVEVNSDEVKTALEWLNQSRGGQWSPLVEVLQIASLDVTQAKNDSTSKWTLTHQIDENCSKCERCRRFHASSSLRSTTNGGHETAVICDRCLEAHSLNGR